MNATPNEWNILLENFSYILFSKRLHNVFCFPVCTLIEKLSISKMPFRGDPVIGRLCFKLNLFVFLSVSFITQPCWVYFPGVRPVEMLLHPILCSLSCSYESVTDPLLLFVSCCCYKHHNFVTLHCIKYNAYEIPNSSIAASKNTWITDQNCKHIRWEW